MTQVAYRAHDLEVLAAIEERHFWFRARRRVIIDALVRWFPQSQTYLEIGCGTGYNVRGIAQAFPSWKITASDPLSESPAVVRIDAANVPFESTFDVIGAYDVIEHLQDDRRALREFRKALAPGGGVLLTVPQHAWLWSAADVYAQHQRRYSRAALTGLLRDCGFEIAGSTSFHTVNLPWFYLRSRWYRTRPYPAEAHAPVAPLNWMLEQGMELDRLLIRAGVRLPLGSSLLVAARRRD